MPAAARVTRGVRRRLDLHRHRGDAVACPVCGGRFDAFKDDWNRPRALCWSCGAHERHRLQWLLFQRRPELLAGARDLLHFAPEWCLRRRLLGVGGLRYVTGDLEPELPGDLRLDVTALELPDAAFDGIICSHVLEHVPQDAQAMRELRRVVRPDGWLVALVPIDATRTETYDDASIATPEARLAAFWQHDHVRLYAPDFADRLRAAGFTVEVLRPADLADEDEIARFGLSDADWLHLCRPASPVG